MSVVGIDLGTTNTVVSCVRQGKVHVLADEHGQRLLPSVVSFHPNGEVLVGSAAKARRVIDPRNTVYSHKRLIGRSWGSPEIVQAKQRFAFELREGPGQGPLVHARGQDYTLPEISAFVLKRARQIAETALGTPVERAVITVPAHFNELQRASTKVAGRVSGLEVLRILNEPTAAALAYGLGRTGNERVAVYDFGGGTFDCTLLDLNGNVFEVLATAGDSFLGGDDVDTLIAERMAESYLKAHRYDPRSDAQMFERLKTTAEDMKMALSSAETHTVVLKEFGFGAGGSSINYTFTLTRRDLDAMMTPLVDRTFKVTQDALSLARLTPTSFDKVILVGGSTRMPLVRQRVEAFFGAPPMDRVNPDEVVAIGAAIQAAALTEGAKRRSIPPPPPVMGGAPTTQRGLQNDLDATQTASVDRGKLAPPGAFGNPISGVPTTRGGPPPAPSQPDPSRGPRKITNPGVAPATQPLGARAPAPSKPESAEEDPSIASFPDLRVPTPFEWFPASGKPGSSERTFGASTLTQPNAPRPGDASFGAIDEPPSMMSTPSASVPSFPSMASGAGGMPSPVGEPEPFRPQAPSEPFGAVRDLSLVSSSGVGTSPGVPSSDDGPFGHVSDLSLISTNTETAARDALAGARQKALAGFDDDGGDTEAMVRNKDAHGNLRGRMPGPPAVEDADLPAVVEAADLPAVSKNRRPEPRRPGQIGPTQSGSSAMIGKPPPPVAPQPFGPMEKVDEPGPASRTGAMPGRPPPAIPKTQQSPVRSPAPMTTAPMPARPAPPVAKPLNTTAPLDQRSPFAATQLSPRRSRRRFRPFRRRIRRRRRPSRRRIRRRRPSRRRIRRRRRPSRRRIRPRRPRPSVSRIPRRRPARRTARSRRSSDRSPRLRPRPIRMRSWAAAPTRR